jgi:hypothetical protein
VSRAPIVLALHVRKQRFAICEVEALHLASNVLQGMFHAIIRESMLIEIPGLPLFKVPSQEITPPSVFSLISIFILCVYNACTFSLLFIFKANASI